MRAGTAALALGLALAPPARAADEAVPIQRYLVSLHLGDRLKDVQILYPPAREWPSYREPKGGVNRIHVERSYAKYFPDDVETLRLGMKHGRLVHIQVVFDAEESRKKPLDELVVELSLMYGEPRRRREAYSWEDGRTVLRVFNAEIPSKDGKAVELRTSMEIMERGVFKPGGD